MPSITSAPPSSVWAKTAAWCIPDTERFPSFTQARARCGARDGRGKRSGSRRGGRSREPLGQTWVAEALDDLGVAAPGLPAIGLACADSPARQRPPGYRTPAKALRRSGR